MLRPRSSAKFNVLPMARVFGVICSTGKPSIIEAVIT